MEELNHLIMIKKNLYLALLFALIPIFVPFLVNLGRSALSGIIITFVPACISLIFAGRAIYKGESKVGSIICIVICAVDIFFGLFFIASLGS